MKTFEKKWIKFLVWLGAEPPPEHEAPLSPVKEPTTINSNQAKPARPYLIQLVIALGIALVLMLVALIVIGFFAWDRENYPVQKTIHYSPDGSCNTIELCTDSILGNYPDIVASCVDIPCSSATVTPIATITPVPPTPVVHYVTPECCKQNTGYDTPLLVIGGVILLVTLLVLLAIKMSLNRKFKHLKKEITKDIFEYLRKEAQR